MSADRDVRIVRQSLNKEWEDFLFTAEEWPDLKSDDSPVQVLFLEGYARDTARKDELLTEVMRFVDIPRSLSSDYLWDFENWGQAYGVKTEWSDHHQATYMTKHASMAMFSVHPPYWGDENSMWRFIRIFCVWELQKPTRIVLVDVPESQIERITSAIKQEDDLNATPYMLHALVLHPIINLHMENMRGISWHRTKVTGDELEDERDDTIFSTLYEQQEESTDLEECFEVAVDTISSIIDDHEKFYKANSLQSKPLNSDGNPPQPPVRPSKSSFESAQNQVKAHLIAFKGFRQRAAALAAGTKRKIALLRDNMSQRDTHASVELARASTRDSSSMKVIAFVTVLFLPATFVSALFGTNFFVAPQGRPSSDQNVMEVSSNFWIYWVISIPLTVLCTVGGVIWHQRVVLEASLAAWQYRRTLQKSQSINDEEAIEDPILDISEDKRLTRRSTGLSRANTNQFEKRKSGFNAGTLTMKRLEAPNAHKDT